jgi:hypothetical protein
MRRDTKHNFADDYAESMREMVTPLAGLPTREIARQLNMDHLRTSRGGLWSSMSVSRLLKRLDLKSTKIDT